MTKATLTIRLPNDLKKRLAEAAQADDRSVGSYLVRLIEKHLGPSQPARGKKAS
jgi:predicted transcriptional regulator